MGIIMPCNIGMPFVFPKNFEWRWRICEWAEGFIVELVCVDG